MDQKVIQHFCTMQWYKKWLELVLWVELWQKYIISIRTFYYYVFYRDTLYSRLPSHTLFLAIFKSYKNIRQKNKCMCVRIFGWLCVWERILCECVWKGVWKQDEQKSCRNISRQFVKRPPFIICQVNTYYVQSCIIQHVRTTFYCHSVFPLQ